MESYRSNQINIWFNIFGPFLSVNAIIIFITFSDIGLMVYISFIKRNWGIKECFSFVEIVWFYNRKYLHQIGNLCHTNLFYLVSMIASIYDLLIKLERTSMNLSSLQGIVKPPIGWLKPNSSSALVSKSWNEGSFT